jgi:nitrate reductase assembly molybdenum cofactor insertion protein NarJ
MNRDAAALDAGQKLRIEDASRWRLIAMLFECPADGWRETLSSLSTVMPDVDLREAVDAAQSEASEGLYHSVFGPGGSASPREVSCHIGMELGSLMSELAAYYDAFGYQPASREPPDHIAVEAGFVGYLRLKEAYAQSCGDVERQGIASDAASDFIKEHLSVVAEPLERKLEGSGIRYLTLAGRALVRSIGLPSK